MDKKTLLKIPLFWILIGWWIWIPYRLIRFLTGYWKCSYCKKWYWVNDGREEKVEIFRHTYGFSEKILTICDECRFKK